MWCRILCVGIFDHLINLINFAYISCITFVLLCIFVMPLYSAVMDKKGNKTFQSHNVVDFGLWICDISAGTSPVVVTVVR